MAKKETCKGENCECKKERKPATAKDRVKDELAELSTRIEKLDNLIGKVKTNNMPAHKKLLDSMSNEQKKLLRKQLKVMKEYKRILEKRLVIWIDED